MFEALQVANRVLEEMSGVHLELLHHGLRIFDRYGLVKADIHCPPPVYRNILYSRITRLIESRDGRLPPPQAKSIHHCLQIPANPVVIDMINRLLDVVGRLGFEINTLFTETHALTDLLLPPSIWGICRCIISGKCTIKDQTTGDILDKWTSKITECSWDAKIKSARELLVDSGGIIQLIDTNGGGTREQPNDPICNVAETVKVKEEMSPAVRTVDRFNGCGGDEDADKDVTGSSSGVKAIANTARRRKQEERGYLVGSQVLWQ